MSRTAPGASIDGSVIIPCFNCEATIGQQLEALERQEWVGDWEVIVSDNGSTDGTRRIAESFEGRLPSLRIVDASGRSGASHARNVGMREARGRMILFCDGDDVVADDYVVQMSKALERHDLVGCRLEETLLNEPWQIESWLNGQKDGLLESTPPFLPFGAGAGLAMTRSLIEAVGEFDPEIRGREDHDYCWRAQLAGFPMHFVSDTHVHYRYPTTYEHMFRQSKRLAQSQIRLYKKYRPHGMPSLSWKYAILGRTRWLSLVRRSVRWRRMGDAERARFVRDFADKLGRLTGSIRYRVLAL